MTDGVQEILGCVVIAGIVLYGIGMTVKAVAVPGGPRSKLGAIGEALAWAGSGAVFVIGLFLVFTRP